MIEKQQLDLALAEVTKKMKKAENSWKHNFLNRFLENAEQEIKKKEHDDFFFTKPKNLKSHNKPEASPKKSPQKV